MEAVIGTDTGESYQLELSETQVQALTGLTIGDEVDGSVLGLDGYTLRITGGSDTEGFPMRASVDGTGRKKLLLAEGKGARNLDDGERTRTSVRGNTVSGQLAQVNMAVVEEGEDDIETLLHAEPPEAGEGGEADEETDEEEEEQEEPDEDDGGDDSDDDEEEDSADPDEEDGDDDEEDDDEEEESAEPDEADEGEPDEESDADPDEESGDDDGEPDEGSEEETEDA